MGIERWIARAARSLERRIEDAKARLGTGGARQVIPYRGFGTQREVYVSGRVLNNPPAAPIGDTDAWWRNLARTFEHLESDEVGGARVRLRIGGAEREAITDEEGFYRAWLSPASALERERWHPVDVDVLEPLHTDSDEVRDVGSVLIPEPGAEYAVISDLDDTVIRTDATRLLRMMRRTLLENARTRLPFEGVARFYQALHEGAAGSGNPIFYVSSSPWNLYPVLTEFLEHYRIPQGPLMLRDWGITERGLLPRGHSAHKLGAIRQIMDCYPGMPFILIGDSGQEDPEIYRDVVQEYAGRVIAVYIRNVTLNATRTRAIKELAIEVKNAGSELLLSDDTLASARHAAERGWIERACVDDVGEEISSAAERPD